ncbi:MAG: DUF6171 family protein [Oscillospiraceae bacterium]|nr:DUF6171 family protein [Oscillospiraceae bacterium]
MSDGARVCRRCLLVDDPSQADMHRTVSDYVALMPSVQRAGESVYKSRLESCAACAHIISGVCRLCGCYAEARAAKRRMACPDSPARWGAV